MARAALLAPITLTGTDVEPEVVIATTICCPTVNVRDCPDLTVNVFTWYVLVGLPVAVSPTRVAEAKSPR